VSLELHLSRSTGLAGKGIPHRSSFVAWVEAALPRARRRRNPVLSIRIVDEAEGRALNRNYRKRDHATNVLSFAADMPPGSKVPLLGDLVICAEVLAREAAEQGKQLRDHYAHMTVHGTLHLLGYDHEADADAERMEALERKILASLGIADPYLYGRE
jgi:probable rRNA maturation factor